MLISQSLMPLKPLVGTGIAAAALGLAALLGAGTAHAGTPDDQFLAALHQQGIGFGNPQSAIGVAHHVCDALGQGSWPATTVPQCWAGLSPVRPERWWPLAVGVVWWTGMPRRRCGRGGEPEFPHRRVAFGDR